MANVLIQLADLNNTEKISELCFVTEYTRFSTSELVVSWITAD
jgi:hypothetical protein